MKKFFNTTVEVAEFMESRYGLDIKYPGATVTIETAEESLYNDLLDAIQGVHDSWTSESE